MMWNFKRLFFIVLFFNLLTIVACQDYPYAIPQYQFIRYDKNQIKYIPSKEYFYQAFEKLNQLYFQGKGKVSIVNIGDSHIQADEFSKRIRKRLQNFMPGAYGGLGYVFPYGIIPTNNPKTYYVKASRGWFGKTNIRKHTGLPMGVGGIAIKTLDPKANLKLFVRKEDGKEKPFDKITIFFPPENDLFSFKIKGVEISEIKHFRDLGYSEIYLQKPVDSFTFVLEKSNASQTHFTLNGFSLELAYTGINYHGLGINGATVPDWLNCSLLNKQLKGLYPDIFVVSLGTNDVYDTRFDSTAFANNFRQLIQQLQRDFPDVPIIATTPGDHYRFRRYLNEDNVKVVNCINALAQEMHFSVWDLNEVMGGLNSIVLWEREKLARTDRVHYTAEGYMLQGDLFFNAFLKEWDKFVDKKISSSAVDVQFKY